MWINITNSKGFFVQSSQLHYEIYLLEFSDRLKKNVSLNVAISDREIIIDKVKFYKLSILHFIQRLNDVKDLKDYIHLFVLFIKELNINTFKKNFCYLDK